MLSAARMREALEAIESRREQAALAALRDGLPGSLSVQAATLLMACALAFGEREETFEPFAALFFGLKPKAFLAHGSLARPAPDSLWIELEPHPARRRALALWDEPFGALRHPLAFAASLGLFGAAKAMLEHLAPARAAARLWVEPATAPSARALEASLRACASLAASCPRAARGGPQGFLDGLDELYAPIFALLFARGAAPWRRGPSAPFASQIAFLARQGLWLCWESARAAVRRHGAEHAGAWRAASFEALPRLLAQPDFVSDERARRLAREAFAALAPDFLLAPSPLSDRSEDRLLPTLCRGPEGAARARSLGAILESADPRWAFCQGAIGRQLAAAAAAPESPLGPVWRQLAERCALSEALPALAEGPLAPQRRI
jgi:hypothetical protein